MTKKEAKSNESILFAPSQRFVLIQFRIGIQSFGFEYNESTIFIFCL